MCACQPGVNLRDYVSLHPPEVTFFLCLLSLAVSLLCLRFYGQTHTLPNPDIATVNTMETDHHTLIYLALSI